MVAARVYHRRVRTPCVDPDEVLDVRVDHHGAGLRRINYMSEKVIFHGLEQAAAMMGDP